MATIRQVPRKGGVSYRAEIHINGVRKSKTFRTKSAARQWARRVEGDQEQVEALGSEGARLDFATVALEYLDQRTGRDPSAVSRVRWWIARIGKRKLTELTVSEIRQALDEYGNGRALRWNGVKAGGGYKLASTGRKRRPASVNRLKASGSAVMRYAASRGYVRKSANVFRDIPQLPENNKGTRWLNDEERERLLQACRQSRWEKLHLLVLMGCDTGMRLSELLGLTWDRIDFTRRTAFLPKTKNGDSRTVPLTETVIRELKRFRGVGAALVFDGKTPHTFRKFFNEARERAGLPDVRFHDTRHTAGTRLANAGASYPVIGAVLGHRSVQTTRRYVHPADDVLIDAVDKAMK